MSKSLKGDPTTPEYWDRRVTSIPDKKDMLFLDHRREEFWKRVREQLRLWNGFNVLDIACGYGQFAEFFMPSTYTGVDFSLEMIKLAEKSWPEHKFVIGNAKEGFYGKFDVIFEVNSLRSLGISAEEFIEKFSPHASVAVACLEADQFTIKQLYS